MSYIIMLIGIFALWHILFFVAYFRKSKKYKEMEQEKQEFNTINKLLGNNNE